MKESQFGLTDEFVENLTFQGLITRSKYNDVIKLSKYIKIHENATFIIYQ